LLESLKYGFSSFKIIADDFWPGTVMYHNYVLCLTIISNYFEFQRVCIQIYRWVSSLDKSLCVRVCTCMNACVCLWAHMRVCVCVCVVCMRVSLLFTHDHVIPDCACYSAPRHKLLVLKLFVLLFMNNWMKFKAANEHLHILKFCKK